MYKFAKSNPHVEIIASMDSGRVPLLIGSYIPSDPTMKVQEHVKELSNMTQFDVIKHIQNMSNRTGRHVRKNRWRQTETVNYSLQGRWYPGMWNKKISYNALIETHRHVPTLDDYVYAAHRSFPIKYTDVARKHMRARFKRKKIA